MGERYMKDITYDQKQAEVSKVLKSIYDMALYTDQNMGKEDYMVENLPPYYKEEVINGITVLKMVHDSPLHEPQLFIKIKGLKACYTYGEWHNIKYKECQLYINKDFDYQGEEQATIVDILTLLSEFINNNHYYVNAKTSDNKIYDNNNQVLNERTTIDLIDNRYITNLTISNINITSADLKMISTMFKHMISLNTNNCFFDNNVSMYQLPIKYYHDQASTFDSLKAFDYATFNISIYRTTFLKPFDNILHLESKEINIGNVDTDYNIFFLKTIASNLRSLTIKNDRPLTERDIKFITNFYNLEVMDIYAEVNNYDFLYKLDKLQEVSDNLQITDERELEQIRKLRSGLLEEWQKNNPEYFEKEFNLKHYLMYQRAIIESKHQAFYKTIRVPRIALVKWLGMMNREEIDIKKHLSLIDRMTLKERKTIGQDDSIDLVQRKDDNYLELLGFDAKAKSNGVLSRYQTFICGSDGNPLLRDIPLMDLSYKKPFLNASGNLLCEFNYRPERTINIPKHIKEYVYEKRADDNPNLTKYYEQYRHHDRKLSFLSNTLVAMFQNLNIDDSLKEKYAGIMNKYMHEQKALALIEDYESWFRMSYLSLLIGTNMLEELASDDKVKEVVASLCEQYEIDEEDKIRFTKDCQKMCHYMAVKRRINDSGLSIDKIIESYFSDVNINITSEIKKDNINDYMLSDIEALSNKGNLSTEHRELLKYYLLYLQEQYNKSLDDNISEIDNLIFGYEEIVGGVYGWPPFQEIIEEEGIEGLLKRGLV
jgi:hypothetical protein